MKINGFKGGESAPSILFATLICTLMFVQVVEASVQCYVCHWHNSVAYRSTNFTDTCSHYNFVPMPDSIVECELGCEAVGIRKSQNEDIAHFYKNCIPPSRKGSVVDKCSTTEEQMQFRTTCECTSDLCNGAKRTNGHLIDFFISLVMLPIMLSVQI